ncbi:nucleotide pyrophosphohydrolase [Candidatus Woesearchaeota archaeon]|nr:nucleotide pyrophosphohydrolase [Candidatus Woesearchaeota archaeon]
MEKEIDKFVELARKTLAECPWANTQTVKTYVQQLASESDEVVAAVNNGDYENLKEELGDLLWDTLMVALIAEKEGWFASKEPLKALVDKMRRRKPFLFTGQKVTLEEAERMWSEAKAKEKGKQK